jgi:hypothetical protein
MSNHFLEKLFTHHRVSVSKKKTLVYTPSGKYFKEKNTCLHTHQVSVKKTTTLIYAPSGKCLKKQQHLFTNTYLMVYKQMFFFL